MQWHVDHCQHGVWLHKVGGMVPRGHEVGQILQFLCYECGATFDTKCAWHGHRTKVHGNNADIPRYASD
eukprot:3799115-Pyramimonas_sp.AAC.1